jgi:hypothetical protein
MSDRIEEFGDTGSGSVAVAFVNLGWGVTFREREKTV